MVLRDEALEVLGPDVSGRTLQMTCCYGNFTPKLAERVARSGGRLDVIDVLAIQLEALARKLPKGAPVRTAVMFDPGGAAHIAFRHRERACRLGDGGASSPTATRYIRR